MKVIKGNDTKLYVNGIEIFCGQDCTFSERKDTVETVGSIGIWKYNRLQKKSWGIDVNGLTKVNNSDGQEDYFTMISDPFSTAPQTITITFVDEDSNTISVQGVMWLQKSSISGASKEFAKASASFIGTGEYILSTEGSSSASSCVPVGGSGFAPPDAEVEVVYSYSFALSGTAPFTLGAVTQPSWMTSAIVGSDLVLGGTPTSGDIGTGVPLSFEVTNDCGTDTFTDDVGISIVDSGRDVFVINNTGASIEIQNTNGVVYTFANGVTGSWKMQDVNFTINVMTGTHDVDILQSLPSTIVNTITNATAVNTYASADFSLTNYLRFNA